jgi:acyl-[acyl-carrier-protein]-phospholipid O-acyltransferase/long-chain-fatty-acid--[acyl-carrier-protein] ligase
MSTTRLLRSKCFLPFFITQFGGAFNDSLFRRGVEMLIAFQGLSGAIPPEIAIFLLLGLFMSPFFICSAFAGYLADVAAKEQLTRYIKIAELVIAFVATYGFMTHSLFFCVVAVVGLGVHSAFFGPIKYSLPAQQVPADELIAANGLIEAGTNIAILLGTILGSTLVVLEGGEGFLALLGCCVAVCGLIASFSIPPAPPKITGAIERKTTIALMQRLYSDRSLWLITLGISWFWTLGAILISLFSLIAKDILKAPELCVTGFFAIFSVGVGIGSLLCDKILRGSVQATYVPLAALGMAAGLFGFYLALPSGVPSPATTAQVFFSLRGVFLVSFIFVLSVSAGLFVVPLYGLLQRATDESERAQIVAANNILNALLMVVGSLALAACFKLGVSVPLVLLGLVVASLLASLWACFLLPEELFKSVLQLAFKSFFRARVSGIEHLNSPGQRGLIVANHLSFLDALMLGAFLPERSTFAVNTQVSRLWWMRPAMACFDMIAIDPTNPMSIRVLIDRLKQDKKVVIFPEGRISITGTLMKVYEGPAMIADKANARLIPIRLEGFQYTFFSRVTNLIRARLFPKLTMTVTASRHLTVDPTLRGRKRREQLGIALHDLMTELLYQTSSRGPTLLHGVVEASCKVGGSKIIARDPLGGSLTLASLLKRSFVLSRVLAPATKNNERIALLLPNGIPMLVFFFALQWLRRTPALLNFSHSIDQMEATCRVCACQTVLTSRKFILLGKLDKHIARIQSLGIQVLFLEDIAPTVTLSVKLRALFEYLYNRVKSACMSFDPIPGSGDDTAVILFTSGSEGTPKGVALSHQNILHNIDQVTSTVPLIPTDKVFNALPMFHSFGLTAGTLMPIIKGVQVFLYPSPLHYRVIPEMVYDESATILFGTPTFLAGYAKKAHPYDFFSVRYVFSGAERLADSIRTTYHERFGLRIFEGYGATETAPAIAINNPFYTKKGTVGRLLPGMEYRLEPIPGIDDGGRLFVKGPNVMQGYYKIDRPGELQPLEDRWYDTGDIVSIDASGFITIKGRAKRFAKIAGEMVSLTAVEQALDTAFSDGLHCVLSVADERKGERLVLVTTQQNLERTELLSVLRAQGLPEIAVPREIRFVHNLPLLGSGKIDVQQVHKLVHQS